MSITICMFKDREGLDHRVAFDPHARRVEIRGPVYFNGSEVVGAALDDFACADTAEAAATWTGQQLADRQVDFTSVAWRVRAPTRAAWAVCCELLRHHVRPETVADGEVDHLPLHYQRYIRNLGVDRALIAELMPVVDSHQEELRPARWDDGDPIPTASLDRLRLLQQRFAEMYAA